MAKLAHSKNELARAEVVVTAIEACSDDLKGVVMKLRIKGNSVRYRVLQSELAQLMNDGRIEETIYFAASESSRFTYALEQSPDVSSIALRYQPSEVAIVLPSSEARDWSRTGQVGMYGKVDLGSRGTLELLVEKDFACIDDNDADNADTFPNPKLGAVC